MAPRLKKFSQKKKTLGLRAQWPFSNNIIYQRLVQKVQKHFSSDRPFLKLRPESPKSFTNKEVLQNFKSKNSKFYKISKFSESDQKLKSISKKCRKGKIFKNTPQPNFERKSYPFHNHTISTVPISKFLTIKSRAIMSHTKVFKRKPLRLVIPFQNEIEKIP